MPIILKLEYEDGTSDVKRIPAEIWKLNQESVTKSFATNKKVINIILDPFLETADVDTENNSLVPSIKPDRFELYKSNNANFRRNGGGQENPMQRATRAAQLKKENNQP